MSAIVMDLQSVDDPSPKRGDLVHTNVGDRRERTWLVLRARRIQRKTESLPRFALFIARWWELEIDMRMRLYASATRNGGQKVFWFKRYPAKKRKSFEDHMRRADSAVSSKQWEGRNTSHGNY